MISSEVKICEKVLFRSKKVRRKNNQLKEKRNDTLDKEIKEIQKNKDCVTYESKNSMTCLAMMKINVGFEIIVIIQ